MKSLKRFWVEIVVACMLAACGMGPSPLYATSLNVTLTYTYSSTGAVDSSNDYPACTQALTTNCVTGFNIYDTTGSTPVLLGKIANANTPSGQQTIIQTLTLNNPSFGTHTAVARTAYMGPDGTSAESADSAPTTFVINPNAPNPPGLILKIAH